MTDLVQTTEHRGRVTEIRTAAGKRHRLRGDSATDLRVRGGDGGYAIALTAMLLIPIMVFLSLAIDLGAWYAQGSRQQRAADAAAMAGVVWLPDTVKASSVALDVAKANGFTTGVTTAPVVGNATQYSVSVAANAPRYFSQVFQGSSFNMTRYATAAFNKPIPMGSPTNTMGNDVNPANCPGLQPVAAAPCGPQPLLWTASNGPYDNYENGDLYSTRCPGPSGPSGAGCDSPTVNPYYRTTGYEYAVDVAAADVGLPITIQTYDIGNWRRQIATSGNAPQAHGIDIVTTNASANVTRSGAYTFLATDVGQPIWGKVGIPGGTTISSIGGGGTTAVLSNPATATGIRGIEIGYDCNTSIAPWNSVTFSGMVQSNCQVGDDGDLGQNMDLQLYDNDGSDLTVALTTQLSCHLAVSADADWTGLGLNTYKNKWAPVCTFTPTKQGIYPLVVRNSGFVATPGQGGFNPVDFGSGTNAYSLKVTGGTATRLYSLNDMSIFTNAPGSQSRFYLAEIKPEHKGKTLNIDLYDPGDGGGSSAYVMQVQAPAAGAPATVPTKGTVIPSANFATACNYNATPSLTKGGGTLTTATNCAVTTHNAGASGGVYNGNWLRVQVKIDPNYNCGTVLVPDCWWTISYNFGNAGLPTDRTVWSIAVVGDPVHLVG